MERITDFHTHSFFSDGVLGPGELVRRAEHCGYGAIGLTDHVDASNIDAVLSAIVDFCRLTQPHVAITLVPGVELTHVPPGQIRSLVNRARKAGARLVVLHGETICEPVTPGTNLAGIKAKVDILAHPGLITAEEVKLAAAGGIYLEISARKSHGLGNGRVAALAKKHNARLVLDSDCHAPGDFLSQHWREKVAYGAGLDSSGLEEIDTNMTALLRKVRPTYNKV